MPRPRPRWRFRLRTLMIAVAVVAVAIASERAVTHRRRALSDRAARFGQMERDCEVLAEWLDVEAGGNPGIGRHDLRSKAEWYRKDAARYSSLKDKYRRAAARPWLPVWPD